VAGPAIFQLFWGMVRTAPDKRDMAAIRESTEKTTSAMKILDAQLGKTKFVAGERFTYGDIPAGIIAFRYKRLAENQPELTNLTRWFEAISSREAFKAHVSSIPLT
jgi:glutathione S-transferase